MIAFIMPIDSPLITLILPGLQCSASTPRLPAFETLIARGSGLKEIEGNPRSGLERWQSQLMQVLSLPAGQFPSAAVTVLGAVTAARGTWLHVTPMHMAVALNGLSIHPVPWSSLHLDAIEACVVKHCHDDGFDWQKLGDALYLHHASPLQVETVAAELAYRLPLRDVQPQGPDAIKINQLFTELQMLLHEHPVLERGTASPINALWLWGVGALPPQQSQALPQAWSDEPYVRGVYQCSGNTCHRLIALDQVHASGENAVIVARVGNMNDAESHWFAPLLDGLRRGQWRAARVFFDDWHFTITQHQLWRFWRRAQSVATLFKAMQEPTT